jgi:hypothetical protein
MTAEEDPAPEIAGEPPKRGRRLQQLRNITPDLPRPDELLREELTEQLDRTRRMLTQSPEEAAEVALERIATETEAEARIAVALAARTPLEQPGNFLEAHRRTMHALEVLDREGSRDPKVPNLGPLTAVAQYGVEFIAEYIVKSYAEGIVGSLRRLYARREVQCQRDTAERQLLSRARIEVERVAPGYSGGGVGAPILIVGGIAIPILASLTNYLGAIDFSDKRILIGCAVALFVVFFALSSTMLRGAAVAHRRSQLIMREPLAALWGSIGHAGSPPEDDSVLFATVAIVITALVWFLLPALAAIFYFVL